MSLPTKRPIWTVKEATVLKLTADLVTANTLDLSINGTAITQVPFNTDHDTTMEDLRAEIQSQASVSSAVLTDIGGDNRTIRINPQADERVVVTRARVESGASQAIIYTEDLIEDNDVNNAESGQPNVSEPLSPNKLLGWDFKEFPPRQWWNWMNRNFHAWLDGMNGFWNNRNDDLISFDSPVFTASETVPIIYRKMGAIGLLEFPQDTDVTTGGTGSLILQFPASVGSQIMDYSIDPTYPCFGAIRTNEGGAPYWAVGELYGVQFPVPSASLSLYKNTHNNNWASSTTKSLGRGVLMFVRSQQGSQ